MLLQVISSFLFGGREYWCCTWCNSFRVLYFKTHDILLLFPVRIFFFFPCWAHIPMVFITSGFYVVYVLMLSFQSPPPPSPTPPSRSIFSIGFTPSRSRFYNGWDFIGFCTRVRVGLELEVNSRSHFIKLLDQSTGLNQYNKQRHEVVNPPSYYVRKHLAGRALLKAMIGCQMKQDKYIFSPPPPPIFLSAKSIKREHPLVVIPPALKPHTVVAHTNVR